MSDNIKWSVHDTLYVVLRIHRSSSTGDSLEKVRKKQARRREPLRRITCVKGFCRRNAVRFLVAGLFALILSVLAISPRVGCSSTINISSSQILTRGHRFGCKSSHVVGGTTGYPDCDQAGAGSGFCVEGWTREGVLTVNVNPILYPINHLFSSEFSVGFARQSKASVTEALLKETLTTETVLSELWINIPLYCVVGLALGAVLEKAVRRARKT